MKKVIFILLAIVLIPIAASAYYIPVYDGSLYPFSGVYEHTFSNPLPATFYGTTIETKPGVWDYVSNVGGMLFLWGVTNNQSGCAPVFQDYILGTEYVWDFDTVPVTPGNVPIPPPVWMLGTGILGLGMFRRKLCR